MPTAPPVAPPSPASPPFLRFPRRLGTSSAGWPPNSDPNFLGGWGTVDDALTSTTKVVTVPYDIPAGAFVAFQIGLNAGLTSVSSVDDGHGGLNTYTQQHSAVNGANSVTEILVTTKLAVPLYGGDRITFTLAASRLRFSCEAGAWIDVVSNTADGATATATATSTTPSAGPTGDPAATRALVLFGGCVQSTVSTVTAGGGATLVGYAREGSSTGERSAFLQYQYVDAPGTQTPSATLDTSVIWTVGAACFDASPPGGIPVTGTMAATEAADTMSASGTETITGTLAATEGADTMSAAATEDFTGTLAATEAPDSMAATAVETFAGTLAATGADDSMAASALETIAGTLAATNADDSMSASGTAAGSVVGSLSAVGANDTAAVAGTVTNHWFKTPEVERGYLETRPYNRHTIMRGVSVVKVAGHYVRYPIPPHTLLLQLIQNVDYFLGGRAAVPVSTSVADALQADGFTVYDHNPDE